MATFSTAGIGPKSASGGISDVQSATLTANTSAAFTVGVRQLIRVSLGGASDAQAAAGVHIRFGLGSNPTAAATDFFIPPSPGYMDFDTGEEFDRFAVISVGTPFVSVMRINRAV